MPKHLTFAALLLTSTAALAQQADRIWSGGPILTMNDKAMRAEAVAEAGGKILAVGKRSEVMKLKGPGTKLDGSEGPDPRSRLCRRPRPHRPRRPAGALGQPAGAARWQGDRYRLVAADAARLGRQKNAAVEKTKIIIGFGYDNSQLKELRHPTKEELDAVSRTIPVIIIHQSSHLAAVNSAAC
jgi:predicted amidohydrolase YtcJ